MNRPQHYAEAERLLDKAKELTEEYVAIDPAATARKIELEMLGRQLVSRAHVHALLATVDIEVAKKA